MRRLSFSMVIAALCFLLVGSFQIPGADADCPSGYPVNCGSYCCQAGHTCCAGKCCSPGWTCCGDGTCCPQGYPNCCPNGRCCPAQAPIWCGGTCYRNQYDAQQNGCTNWVMCGAPVR